MSEATDKAFYKFTSHGSGKSSTGKKGNLYLNYICLKTNFFAFSDGMEKIQVTNKPLVARWSVPPKKSTIPRLWVASTFG